MYSHRLELNVLNAVLLIDVFLTVFIFQRFFLFSCYSKRLFLKSIKSFYLFKIIFFIVRLKVAVVHCAKVRS